MAHEINWGGFALAAVLCAGLLGCATPDPKPKEGPEVAQTTDDSPAEPPAPLPEGFEYLFPTDQAPQAFFSAHHCVAGAINTTAPDAPRRRLDGLTSLWLSYPSPNFEHESYDKFAAEFPLRAALPATATDAHRRRLEDVLHEGRGLLYLRRVDAAADEWEVVAYIEVLQGLGQVGWSEIGLKVR